MKPLITALALAILISASAFIVSANGNYDISPLAEGYRQVSQYCVPQDSDEPQTSSHKIYCRQPWLS
jgi:hypothetical protein